MSSKPDDYRARATECEKRADETPSGIRRQHFHDLARRWRELAEQAELVEQ
jgi:hypothetical protein